MMFVNLAIRNLRGAGVRTWLNALALSFAFVAIIFGQGMLQGMNRQIEDASVAWEYAGGQYWQQGYDPYDPLSLDKAHAPVPAAIADLVREGRAVPILVIQGSIYPQGRVKPVFIKGIDPGQKVLAIPSAFLADATGDLPLLIGNRMAKSTGLAVGDYVTVQWRDAQGAFDASDGRVAGIMQTSVGTIDAAQVWVPLARLQELAGMPGEATLATVAHGVKATPVQGWVFRPQAYLLSDLRQVMKSKTIGQSIMFTLLFLLAMLAIFDTQVLSIFRRRREIGMLVALGMTKAQVIAMFTFEGALHGVLAAILGAVYASPLFIYLARNGIAIPGNDTWGFAMSERLYPAYTVGLILGTTLLVLMVTTIVSYLPTRRIAKLKPTEALSGRGT